MTEAVPETPKEEEEKLQEVEEKPQEVQEETPIMVEQVRYRLVRKSEARREALNTSCLSSISSYNNTGIVEIFARFSKLFI